MWILTLFLTQREDAVRKFRSGAIWILICTNLMGRGIDFIGVNLVINYDFPLSAISYIHAIGEIHNVLVNLKLKRYDLFRSPVAIPAARLKSGISYIYAIGEIGWRKTVIYWSFNTRAIDVETHLIAPFVLNLNMEKRVENESFGKRVKKWYAIDSLSFLISNKYLL